MSWRTDSSAELLPHFKGAAAFFGIGEPLSMERVGGHANKNYRVRTVAGSFIFKVVIEHPLEDLITEVLYLDRLAKNGFPAAQYVKTAHGDFYYRGDDGTLIVVLAELPGTAPPCDENTNFAIGQTIARLHTVEAAGLPSRYHWLRRSYLQETIEALTDQFAAERTQLTNALSCIEVFPYDHLPQSIIHGDMSPRNSLFLDGQLVAFLDWEECGMAPCILDFAVCAIFFSEDGKLVPQHYRALAKGYLSVRSFTKLELEFLPMAFNVVGLTISAWGLYQFGVRHPDPEMVKGWNYYWDMTLNPRQLPDIT
jgi:Ser/Thr protein kinase RdoA (MazF antagonist)